jgi:hypothetical protein
MPEVRVPTTLRLPLILHGRLKAIAKAENITLQDLMVRCLQKQVPPPDKRTQSEKDHDFDRYMR